MFADDIVICRSRRDNVERTLEKWRRAREQRGLKISRMKTQYLGCNEHQDAEIHLQGETGKGVHSHTWDRRWRMMENWMQKSPAECRVQGWCNNWQRVSVVLCHRRMKVKINGKVNRQW